MKRILFFMFLIVIAISLYAVFAFYCKKENFNCRTNFNISNYGLNASVVATIRTENGRRVIFYDGPVYKNGVKVGYFNRQVRFIISNNKFIF